MALLHHLCQRDHFLPLSLVIMAFNLTTGGRSILSRTPVKTYDSTQENTEVMLFCVFAVAVNVGVPTINTIMFPPGSASYRS